MVTIRVFGGEMEAGGVGGVHYTVGESSFAGPNAPPCACQEIEISMIQEGVWALHRRGVFFRRSKLPPCACREIEISMIQEGGVSPSAIDTWQRKFNCNQCGYVLEAR